MSSSAPSDGDDLKTRVVAAIIQRDGKFLVGLRSIVKTSAPGVWCAVMGRVEPGETEEQAVAREVMEEVGLLVAPLEVVYAADTRDGSARIHWWWTATLDTAPARLANGEHSQLRWVTVEEMGELRPVFMEDVEVFRRLAARRGG